MRKGCVLLAVVFLLAVAGGCGYRLARYDNPLLKNVHSIAIPYFKNKTFEPEAEAIFTYAVVDEFIESRKLSVVAEAEADVVLYGSIEQLREDTIAYSRDDKALEYRVIVELDVELLERSSGKVLWKRDTLLHAEEFPVTSDSIARSEAAKRAALRDLAADLAERVHDSIMQGF